MGARMEASQAPRCRGVPGSEGVFDQQEKEQEEQQELISALTGTLHHFFGGFSPSICQYHRPPRSYKNPLSSRESCLRRRHDVSIPAQGETTDWIVAPQRSLGHQIPSHLWSEIFSSWRYTGSDLFESGDRPDSDGRDGNDRNPHSQEGPLQLPFIGNLLHCGH